MTREQKEEFIRRMKVGQTIHLMSVSDTMGLSWGDVVKEIRIDNVFRQEIEEILERFKYDIYQSAFEKATGRKAVRQSFDLSTARSMLVLLSSGELIPGSGVKPKDQPPAQGGELDLLERIGISLTPANPDNPVPPKDPDPS